MTLLQTKKSLVLLAMIMMVLSAKAFASEVKFEASPSYANEITQESESDFSEEDEAPISEDETEVSETVEE